MQLRVIVFWILIFGGLELWAQETKKILKPQKESQEELDLKEFQEFKEMRERQRREKGNPNSSSNFSDWTDSGNKNLYIFLQGGSGNASTQFENGKMQFGKAGFEYRTDPSFGIGLSVGNNSLDLHSKDLSNNLFYAYLLLSAYNNAQLNSASQEEMFINQILYSKFLDSPDAFFYLSNVFKYRYNTAQVDFNFHLNRENFFDPFIGFSIIGGYCTGIYPCQIRGGELKLGIQLNQESTFTFFQLQRQIISIKEPGFEAFQSNHNTVSLGTGLKF